MTRPIFAFRLSAALRPPRDVRAMGQEREWLYRVAAWLLPSPVGFGNLLPVCSWFSHCPLARGPLMFCLAPRTGELTPQGQPMLSHLCHIPQVGLTCGEAFLLRARPRLDFSKPMNYGIAVGKDSSCF